MWHLYLTPGWRILNPISVDIFIIFKKDKKVNEFGIITMIITLEYVLIKMIVHTQNGYTGTLFFKVTAFIPQTHPSLCLEVSIVECGSWCLLNQCRKEFIYSRQSQWCIRVHFLDFQNTSSSPFNIWKNVRI